MVKGNRLYNRIEPFIALFWALGNVLAHILKQVTQPADLASLNRCTGTDCSAGVSLVQIGSFVLFISVVDPHLLLCGSGFGIRKMSIWIRILGGKD